MKMKKEIMKYVRRRIEDKAASKVKELTDKEKAWRMTMQPKPEEVAVHKKHLVEMKQAWEKELRAYLSYCPLADELVLKKKASPYVEIHFASPVYVREAYLEHQRLNEELVKLSKAIDDVYNEIIAKLSLGGTAEDMERMIADVEF